MILGLEAILIGSSNARKLAEFYRDVVGFKITMEMEIGEKEEMGFVVDLKNKMNLYILDHSKVKGKNQSPERIMFNLEVDNIEKEVARIKKNGAKLIKDSYHVQDYGFIATFADTDGNYFQLVKTKE